LEIVWVLLPVVVEEQWREQKVVFYHLYRTVATS